jgi:hypothetical protein
LKRLFEKEHVQVKTPARSLIVSTMRLSFANREVSERNVRWVPDDEFETTLRRSQEIPSLYLDLLATRKPSARDRCPARMLLYAENARDRTIVFVTPAQNACDEFAFSTPRIEQSCVGAGRVGAKQLADHQVDEVARSRYKAFHPDGYVVY